MSVRVLLFSGESLLLLVPYWAALRVVETKSSVVGVTETDTLLSFDGLDVPVVAGGAVKDLPNKFVPPWSSRSPTCFQGVRSAPS